ncbi:MAG: hypothetical protein ACLU9S_21430 [Oscillospiraceae bacterium]
MPTRMMGFFSRGELSTMQRHPGFSFTKGLPVMQIESDPSMRCIEKEICSLIFGRIPGRASDRRRSADPAFHRRDRAPHACCGRAR